MQEQGRQQGHLHVGGLRGPAGERENPSSLWAQRETVAAKVRKNKTKQGKSLTMIHKTTTLYKIHIARIYRLESAFTVCFDLSRVKRGLLLISI